MEIVRDDTIGAFNAYVGEIAKDLPGSRLSLTQFDSQGIDLVIDNAKIGDVPRLTRETFIPRGGTPLLDAIGNVAAKLDALKADRKALVILTDGQENASREWKKETVRKMLEAHQEKDGWLVIYLGANQDAFAEGFSFGTQAGNTMNFAATKGGMSNTMASAARATRSYFAAATASAGQADASFTTDERLKSADGKVDTGLPS
jgi:hypothetical protein